MSECSGQCWRAEAASRLPAMFTTSLKCEFADTRAKGLTVRNRVGVLTRHRRLGWPRPHRTVFLVKMHKSCVLWQTRRTVQTDLTFSVPENTFFETRARVDKIKTELCVFVRIRVDAWNATMMSLPPTSWAMLELCWFFWIFCIVFEALNTAPW